MALAALLNGHCHVLVLSGAGCSTGSGLPAYRDVDGNWQHPRPMLYGDFCREPMARRRYWIRSLRGWPAFAGARPNATHAALAALETDGRINGVITQNVDGLHQQAGSRQVLDLHGRLDRVRCLGCNTLRHRAEWQEELAAANPGWLGHAVEMRPDGAVLVQDDLLADFRVPDCRRCGGVLKPDVVFFGEAIPATTRDRARAAVAAADALLVVGSSLMVWSGFDLVRQAAAAGKPVGAINRGRTRADGLLRFKVDADCGPVLRDLLASLPDRDGSAGTSASPR